MSEQIDNEQAIEVQEIAPEALPSVGAILRSAREGRALQVGDIAQALKLGQRQVEALERDDWSVLPGTTFIRGFVRNYARLVDVDPAPLMAGLEGQLEKPANTLAVPEATPTRISNASKSRDGLVVGIGALLLVLAGLAYFLLPNDLNALRDTLQGMISGADKPVEATLVQPAPPPVQEALFPPDSTPQQLIAPEVAPAEGAAQSAPVATAEAPVPDPQLRFVLSQASWLEVRDRDDTVVFSQRLIAGSEQAVGGRGPLSVTVGYAPGVKLFHRGQVVNLEPHTRGDVARLVLE
jgi:cytoskeleton protein RodZ